MTLNLRRDDFISFVSEKAENLPEKPTFEPEGLIILSGGIVRNNLKDYLDKEEIPISPLAKYTTIEELSGRFLREINEPDQIISDGLLNIMTEEILTEAETGEYSEELEKLAQQIHYEEESVREVFLEEFDEYLRCTDAGSDIEDLKEILGEKDFKDEFAKKLSKRVITSFSDLHDQLKDRLKDMDNDYQLSRSHLVKNGRTALESEWDHVYDHIEWIAIVTINTFDNPTLRFLKALNECESSPDVSVFLEHGSYEYQSDRIESVIEDVQRYDTDEIETDKFVNENSEKLFQAAHGSRMISHPPDKANFIEAPDDRRLIEHIAKDIRHRIQNGASPEEFLIIANEAGNYKSLIENVFETVEIPVHVETRHPVANLPAYRFLKDFVTVIEKAENEELITYGELLDPLRLGYCKRGAYNEDWPIVGRVFTTIEQRLQREQQSKEEQYETGLSFEHWKGIIENDIENWHPPKKWDLIEEYLDDIESHINDVPNDGEDLLETLKAYLGTYIRQTVFDRRRLHQGPGIDTTRKMITKTHATNHGERVRDLIDSVTPYYDQILEIKRENSSNYEPTWEDVGRTLSGVLGSETYGEKNLDKNAVPVVDAGNSYFRTANHIYFLGMTVDEFPSTFQTPTFIPVSLRKRVYEEVRSGDYPYLHLDSKASSFMEDLDFYESSLTTIKDEDDSDINFFHSYKDTQGNTITWSPFVDIFDLEEEIERIDVGDWFSKPRSNIGNLNETWESVSERISERERLRAILYHAHRSQPDTVPAITSDELQTLIKGTKSDTIVDQVLPRVERYQTPPTQVVVAPDEPAFNDRRISLEDFTGGASRPHELDLYGQCGLKYYYYQFLYNFEGDKPKRNVPYYSSNKPHHRLGTLPKIIKENYVYQKNITGWKAIIEELLPNRQEDLIGFDGDIEIKKWMNSKSNFNKFDMSSIYGTLCAERELIQSELEEDINRDWEWRDEEILEIEGEKVYVPPHRVDTVETTNHAYYLPIFYARFSTGRGNFGGWRSAFKGALKTCQSNSNGYEECSQICENCNDLEECEIRSKYILDHRMIGGYDLESNELDHKVIGIGLQHKYADRNGGRIITLKSHHSNELVQGSDFEQIYGRGCPDQWYKEGKLEGWRADISSHIEDLNPNTPITFEANEEIVHRDDCLDCIYRDLCFVPVQEDDI